MPISARSHPHPALTLIPCHLPFHAELDSGQHSLLFTRVLGI